MTALKTFLYFNAARHMFTSAYRSECNTAYVGGRWGGGLQLKRWHLLHPARINLLCPQKCSLGCYSETFDFRMKFIFQWKHSHFSVCWKERRWPEQPSRFWTITLLYHIIRNIPRALSSITQSWSPALHNYYICQRGWVTASVYLSVGEQNNLKSYKWILMKFSGNYQWL